MSVLAVSISDTPPYTEDHSTCENGAHFILLPVYIKSEKKNTNYSQHYTCTFISQNACILHRCRHGHLKRKITLTISDYIGIQRAR
jgi:hypothetical protein